MNSKEYIIWCDESVKKGEYYSNFYGGILISSNHLQKVLNELSKKINEIGITEEIKWGKVDSYKLPAFIALMDVFFELVKQNKIKVRIMFTQNALKPIRLQKEQIENEYFLLYYQFFKHSFGLAYSNKSQTPKNIIVYFDYLPDTFSKRVQFKDYIKGLEKTKSFIDAKLKVHKQNITEVDSKKHLPIQFLDVILGAMQFRLNNLHKKIPEGQYRRGKRTIAKEKLYKHILAKIREIKPRFNIGISTGINNFEDNFNDAYRHWCFTSKNIEIDKNQYK